MNLTHPLISPAYYLESAAYNPQYQPANGLQKHVLARIIAVTAPIFYAFQVGLHLVLALIDLAICLVGITDGNACKRGFSSVMYSIRCLFSSTLEIPHKLINGPDDVPNYCGNKDRYFMIGYHRWENKIVWS